MSSEELVKALRVIICEELRGQNNSRMTPKALQQACIGRIRKQHLTSSLGGNEIVFACFVEALDSLIKDGHVHERQVKKRITISLCKQ